MSANPVPEIQTKTGETFHFKQHMGRVSRQSAVFFVGTIFSASTAYLFKVYLARTLGAEALGIYALGMTIVNLVSIFNGLGIPHSALRFVSSYCATGKIELLRSFLARSVVVLLVFNVLLGGAMLVAGPWVAVHFYHAPELKPYIGLFAAIMLLGILTMFFGHVLAAYKDVTRRTIIINFIGGPLMMLLAVAFITAGMHLWGYILAQVVSAVVVLLLLVAATWRLTPPAVRSSFTGLVPLPHEVVSFSSTALALGLLEFSMSRTDSVAIGFYLHARELGIYAVATAVVTFVSIILRSVNQIFAPTISDLHSRSQIELLGRMFQTLTKWIVGLTIPLAAVMIIFAAPLMGIFGRDFEAGWRILVIGTIGQLINCVVGSSGTLLFMSGNQKSLVRIQIATALVMLVLNLLLVPRWGIIGAAVASAVTVGLTNLAYLYEVRRKLTLFPYNRSYWRLVLPLAGSLSILLVFKLMMVRMRLEWLVIGLGLLLAYLIFAGLAYRFALDADDRIVARAFWSRISSALPKMEATPDA